MPDVIIDITTITNAEGFAIIADKSGDQAGYSVSDAGDVNGDGIDDVIIGVRNGDSGGGNSGEAFVIFGTAGLRGPLDLTNLTAAQGFKIFGESQNNAAGYSVSGAGDVNNDGLADLLVGAYGNDNADGLNTGAAYVVYGSAAERGPVSLALLGDADGFKIIGDEAGDLLGDAVSGAGDVNGDGIDDIIVGARLGQLSDNNSGEAYVIYGREGTRGTLDTSALTTADGYVIAGADGSDNAGQAVSGAGDVNGDGIGDLIIGAPTSNDGGGTSGAAYIIYGQAGTRGALDLGALAEADGFTIIGDLAGDNTGTSVANAGDINGDEIGDFIVGAPYADDNGNLSGKAYVIYGQTGTRGPLDLTTLTADDGFAIIGEKSDDFAGTSVSGAGDVNDDGIDDLIVGAPQRSDANGNPGHSYVVFGQTGLRDEVDLASLTAAQGFAIVGGGADLLGTSVSAAGDVNGDGVADILIGEPLADQGGSGGGAAYVLYGVATPPPTNVEPDITSNGGGANAAVNVAENTAAVTTVVATDPDAGDSLTYSINGGADAALFAIDAATGALSFIAAPNFELPTDSNGDNAYSVTVRATDGGGLFDVQTITVTVTDVDEGVPGAVIIGTELKDVINPKKTVPGQPLPTALADQIEGLGGNDVIDGGLGADVMIGGIGNDSYVISEAGDTVIELADEGRDSMKSAVVDLVLADNVENGTLTDVKKVGADLDATGNGLANVLNGNSGDNMLYGEDGDDKLNGKAGADVLYGGAGEDQFKFDKFALEDAIDLIMDFSQAEGDRISFAAIDADGDALNGNSKFVFIGEVGFSGAGAELRYYQQGGDSFVAADVDGDMVADVLVEVNGLIDFTAADFIL